MKIKKGDTVIVITGKDKGKTGVVDFVIPQTNRVAVTGVNKYKKHVKRSAKNPQGGIIETVRALHVSNVMILDSNKKPTRVGYKVSAKDKIRVARTTAEEIAKK